MTQFNLLPDVKLQYIRANRAKKSIITVSVVVAAVSLGLLVLMVLVVDVFQKKYLHDINNDIGNYTNQLKQTQDLDKILTVQNQLTSLPSLHNQKPVTSRLFKYLAQIVPAKVNISTLNIDFTAHTITFQGSADSINTVNTFVDTLKFTTYSTANGAVNNANVFTSVVLSSFGLDSSGHTNYSINANFNADIFDSSKNVKVTVPAGKITTRSETEKPTDLFKPSAPNQTPQ